jgi:RecA-family ATPase
VSDRAAGGEWTPRHNPNAEATPPKSLETFSAAELLTMQLNPPPMLIPTYVAVGLNILGGDPKGGKSWLALQMAYAVATGGFFLGEKATQGRALYLALEDTKYRLKHRMMALKMQPTENLVFCTGAPLLAAGGLQAIHDNVHENPGTKLVIIDTLGRMKDQARGNSNAYEADTQLGAALQATANAGEFALVIIHHMAKARGRDFLLNMSGAVGLPGTADAVMAFQRRRNATNGKLHITGRDIGERATDLEWVNGGGWRLMNEAYTDNRMAN